MPTGRLSRVRRRFGYLSLLFAAVAAILAGLLGSAVDVPGVPSTADGAVRSLGTRGLFAVAVLLGCYGLYLLLVRYLVEHATSKRRAHDVRNVLRLALGSVALAGVLGAVTDQWLGVLFSLGIVGFGITFALQQPLLSFLGWIYIMIKRPLAVGDRVKIGDAKGDVIEVDFLVTTLWEVGGDLVTSHQPSGRVVTVPNSVVLSSDVINYTTMVEYVWNELSVQVAYETDLEFAREAMVEEADGYLGPEMARNVADYRRRLAETAVELEVSDRPSVNVVQEESWVSLRLRYLTHPRRGTRVRNELYQRILERFTQHPDRVKFPVGRNR